MRIPLSADRLRLVFAAAGLAATLATIATGNASLGWVALGLLTASVVTRLVARRHRSM